MCQAKHPRRVMNLVEDIVKEQRCRCSLGVSETYIK